jgi:hypothetical protein
VGVLAQAESEMRAAAARQGRMNFFTGAVVVLTVNLRPSHDYIFGCPHTMGC